MYEASKQKNQWRPIPLNTSKITSCVFRHGNNKISASPFSAYFKNNLKAFVFKI